MSNFFVALLAAIAMAGCVVSATTTTKAVPSYELLHPARPVPSHWREIDCSSAALVPDPSRITVSVTRRNVAAMDALFWEVSDPQLVERYGKHLDSAAMRELVGATETVRQAVENWLQSSSSPRLQFRWNAHHDAVIVEAPMSVLEGLLKTQFCLFEQTTTGRRLYRAPGATYIPQALRGLVEVVAGHSGFPARKQPNAYITGAKTLVRPQRVQAQAGREEDVQSTFRT